MAPNLKIKAIASGTRRSISIPAIFHPKFLHSVSIHNHPSNLGTNVLGVFSPYPQLKGPQIFVDGWVHIPNSRGHSLCGLFGCGGRGGIPRGGGDGPKNLPGALTLPLCPFVLNKYSCFLFFLAPKGFNAGFECGFWVLTGGRVKRAALQPISALLKAKPRGGSSNGGAHQRLVPKHKSNCISSEIKCWPRQLTCPTLQVVSTQLFSAPLSFWPQPLRVFSEGLTAFGRVEGWTRAGHAHEHRLAADFMTAWLGCFLTRGLG